MQSRKIQSASAWGSGILTSWGARTTDHGTACAPGTAHRALLPEEKVTKQACVMTGLRVSDIQGFRLRKYHQKPVGALGSRTRLNHRGRAVMRGPPGDRAATGQARSGPGQPRRDADRSSKRTRLLRAQRSCSSVVRSRFISSSCARPTSGKRRSKRSKASTNAADHKPRERLVVGWQHVPRAAGVLVARIISS